MRSTPLSPLAPARGAWARGGRTASDGASLRVYRLLDRVVWPKSYLAKFAVVAFVSTHLPLLALLLFVSLEPLAAPGATLWVALAATAAGMVMAVALTRGLLAPVFRAARALETYLDEGEAPALPTDLSDDAGLLLRDVQRSLERLADQQERLRFEANRDALTGLHNRRAAERLLAREVAAAEREGRPMCVAVLDLDRFKAVNDRFGHAEGDRVLRTLAEAARGSLRETDWAARWGGDEFVLALACDVAGAHRAIERIVEAFGARLPERRVGLSAGVVRADGAGLPIVDLVASADAALYRAKGAGGDRIETGP